MMVMNSTSELSASARNVGVGSWPARRAQLTPDAVAFSFEGTDTTFAQVEHRVAALANALLARGVLPGSRIAYMGGNHPALLECLFAAGRIGAITVLINARLSRHETHYILQDCGASVLLLGAEQLEQFGYIECNDVPELRHLINVDPELTDDKTLRLAQGWRPETYPEVLAATEPTSLQAQVSLDDPCLIMYTSGTTGRPKGAVLTHGNIFFNDMNVLIETDIRNDEVCLAAAPLFHIAGLNGLVLPVFLKGGRIVLVRAFRAQAALEIIEREKITCMFGVPAMLDSFSQNPAFPDADLSSLRTLIVGGAPVPTRILRQFTTRGVDIQQGYGLTETSPAVLKLSAEDAVHKVGSAGKPQFLVDVQVQDANGEPIKVGETGEILTRGPNVFKEYWNRPADTDLAFADGWFRTGDLATIDEDGHVFLRDRSKDMYISGGENVYPSEIENALLDIQGIVEAAVIGVPNDQWGEIGAAYLVLEPNSQLEEQAILDSLQGRLARYKQPKRIHLVEELPRTSTGKLQKHVLRQLKENQ